MASTVKYDFEDLSVEKCFSNFYIVPDYQREYVWEADKQVEQLLNDIDEEYSSDAKKEYFIGTTVVFNNNGTKELIDGQQRTTTLFIALCAFRSIYAELGIPYGPIAQCISNETMDDDGNTVLDFFYGWLAFDAVKKIFGKKPMPKSKYDALPWMGGKERVEPEPDVYGMGFGDDRYDELKEKLEDLESRLDDRFDDYDYNFDDDHDDF